jgi:hypothetical protein
MPITKSKIEFTRATIKKEKIFTLKSVPPGRGRDQTYK